MSKKPLGALLLHGFSGMPIGLGKLAHHIENLGLPYQAPTLRGHGAETPDALLRVKWTDWIIDAEKAMWQILAETEKVTVIGHSMGGMLALLLAAGYKEQIDSIIVAGGSTKSVSPFGPGRPLNFLAPVVMKVKKNWDMTPIFTDPECARYDTGYAWVPTITWLQVFEVIKETHRRLPEVTVPTLILHSRNDTANSPDGAQILYDTIATQTYQKKLVWFERTEHVMFLDCEEEEINHTVIEYLQGRIKDNQ
jgi:carboxylesterase